MCSEYYLEHMRFCLEYICSQSASDKNLHHRLISYHQKKSQNAIVSILKLFNLIKDNLVNHNALNKSKVSHDDKEQRGQPRKRRVFFSFKNIDTAGNTSKCQGNKEENRAV